MTIPKSIRIREVGAREGLQTMSTPIPTPQKLELIEALSCTGVKDIEVTSFVRPDRIPQMADAAEVVATFKRHEGVRYTALYLNPKGFQLGEESGRLDNEGWLNIAASETFLIKNNNTTLAKAVASIPEWLAGFTKFSKPLHGLMLSTAFGCSYEGKIPPEKVVEILGSVVRVCDAHGSALREVCLADTMGWGTPELVKRVVTMVRKAYPALTVSLHLHDTRGTGLANVYAGLEEGIDCFDASLGGLGGCPFAKGAAGNVTTEDVVFMCEEMGISTGISLDRYVEAARLAARIFGRDLPGKLYKAWG